MTVPAPVCRAAWAAWASKYSAGLKYKSVQSEIWTLFILNLQEVVVYFFWGIYGKL